MYFQKSIGINIESSRLSLIYLRRSFRGWQVGGHIILSLEKEDLEDKAAEIRKHVNEFLDANRIVSADVFLGIQRDLTILRYIELPLAVKENLKGTLLYEMEKYVPLPVSDIYFDFQIVSEDRAAGTLKVLLIAVKKQLVDPFLDSENRLGDGISGIEINSTALVNCISGQSGLPDADIYAVLSINDEHFELGLVKKGLLNYSRHVARDKDGGDLQRLFDEEIELLKKTLGPAPGPLGIVYCGANGSVEELCQAREDIYLHSPDLSGAGLPSDALAPAYGLALKGGRKTSMNINFLPVDLRKKVSKIPYYTMLALAGLLFMMILAWAGSNFMYQRYVSTRLENELKQLGTEVAAINKTREDLAELESRVDELNLLYQRHLPVLNILRELTEDMPSDAWLTRLNIVDGKGDMEGYADSASALIPLLVASPQLKDVAFLSPITKTRDGKERFRIGFTVR